ELHERKGSWLLVIAANGREENGGAGARVKAQIDRSWACDILSGAMSPIAALDRRLGQPGPALLDGIRVIVADRALQGIESTLADPAQADIRDRISDLAPLPSSIREAV